MQRLEYRVTFTTPAFLGNADRQGQWRTPPFKALLRQWWRVVYAPKVGFDVDTLRREEGRLFGVAVDGGESRQSKVRLRLSGGWGRGDYSQIEDSGRICHPEVEKGGPPCAVGAGRKIEANLYLGYGPIGVKGLSRPPAISPTAAKANTLAVAGPKQDMQPLMQAIALAEWFGTIGSRSRNGWGAVEFDAIGETPSIARLSAVGLADVERPLAQCLQLDWPHAVGVDGNGPLVWLTQQLGSWREVMKELARIKIAFRTQPALSLAGIAPGKFAARHLLAYPVTHHPVDASGWGNQGRLGNQLRFKVMKKDGQWTGVLVHLPCRLPTEMIAALPPHLQSNLDAVALETWQAVHRVLDKNAVRLI